VGYNGVTVIKWVYLHSLSCCCLPNLRITRYSSKITDL